MTAVPVTARTLADTVTARVRRPPRIRRFLQLESDRRTPPREAPTGHERADRGGEQSTADHEEGHVLETRSRTATGLRTAGRRRRGRGRGGRRAHRSRD